MFSSVREGDTRSLIERDVELWNARDHESWLAGWDLGRMALEAPGGIRMTGREAVEAIWSTWIEAFPDNQLEIMGIHADDRGGVHEGRFTGTHTGTLRGLATDEIAATGRTVEARFAGVYEFEEGKITSWHLYFDRADMLSQLGIRAGGAPSGMLPADHGPGPARPAGQPLPAGGSGGAPGTAP
jgi:limonene-1,2-epoxide hydrolase